MSNEGTLLQDLEKLRALAKPTISKEEAETCQKWAGMDGATAFHLIERHAVNWADTRLMMDAWLQANLSARAEVGACKWTPDDDGIYQTKCGEAFTFIDAGPKENNMKFCCYCGGSI